MGIAFFFCSAVSDADVSSSRSRTFSLATTPHIPQDASNFSETINEFQGFSNLSVVETNLIKPLGLWRTIFHRITPKNETPVDSSHPAVSVSINVQALTRSNRSYLPASNDKLSPREAKQEHGANQSKE